MVGMLYDHYDIKCRFNNRLIHTQNTIIKCQNNRIIFHIYLNNPKTPTHPKNKINSMDTNHSKRNQIIFPFIFPDYFHYQHQAYHMHYLILD